MGYKPKDSRLFDALLSETRAAFLQAREQLSSSTIYGYALLTDSDPLSICDVVNTEESFRQHRDDLNQLSKEFEVDEQSDEDFVRCSVDEWQHFGEPKNLERSQAILNELRARLPEVGSTNFEDESAQYGLLRSTVFETCVCVLEQLVAEGFFGCEADREKLVIRFYISDSNEGELFDNAARRLNTSKVYQRYKATLSV